MEGEQGAGVVPTTAVGDRPILPRPAQCSIFTDEQWAKLDEEKKDRLLKIYNRKIVFSENYRRFLNEFIIGTDNSAPDCAHTPNDSEGTVKLPPWRIFTDPVAQGKLLDVGNEYHKELEEKELDAMKPTQPITSDGGNVEKAKSEQRVVNSQQHMDPYSANDYEVLSRDVRVSDTLRWLRNRTVHVVAGQSLLGPMRYTSCNLGDRCLHFPSPILQIFDVWVKCYLHDDIVGPYIEAVPPDYKICWKMAVYGMIAIRGALDDSWDYIFNRSRENPQVINANGGYLCLKNPSRAISAMDCLIEIDIKIKADDIEEDCTIADGCVEAVGMFDRWSMNHVDTLNGRVIFESSVVNEGVEATIELDFLEVPVGGFHARMCGKTDMCKSFYSFIGDRRPRECDGFVPGTGKHGQKFVAAVSVGDTLHIDFMEGRDTLSFVASKHGNEHQLYRFNNGAVVFVQVYWSTIGIVDPICNSVAESLQ